MTNRNLPLQTTRRRFLEMVGKVAGSAALYDTMVALNLIAVPAAWAGPPRLPANSGAGKTVAILGAGMAGLSAAYELQKAGYSCIVLELLDRAGGRNLTARNGTTIVEDSGPNGRTQQTCSIDDGLYMNLGPGRLPYHHLRVMHYCREFALPLEVYVITTTANLYQTDGAFNGAPQPRYRLISDTHTYIAELLTKAIDVRALDAALSPEDVDKFKSLLSSFGGTGVPMPRETPRDHCEMPMSLEGPCEPNPRLPLTEILNSEFWNRGYQPEEGDWQPTLFEITGGNDKIVDAFVKRLRSPIRYNVQVQRIEKQDGGVVVAYRDRKTGETHRITADYCLSSIPLPKLSQIEANFSDDYTQAIARARPMALFKLLWQANRRFWEEEPYNIYGGISYTTAPITQMWYPSTGFMGKNGIVAGSYSYLSQAEAFGRMTLAERINLCRQGATKLHKEFADETIVPGDKAMSVAWNQAEGQSGGLILWDHSNAEDHRAYHRLLSPDGRFQVIGDQVSPLAGWQEGAFMSSENAVRQIAGV
jgi:monoamine oxidase